MISLHYTASENSAIFLFTCHWINLFSLLWSLTGCLCLLCGCHGCLWFYLSGRRWFRLLLCNLILFWRLRSILLLWCIAYGFLMITNYYSANVLGVSAIERIWCCAWVLKWWILLANIFLWSCFNYFLLLWTYISKSIQSNTKSFFF